MRTRRTFLAALLLFALALPTLPVQALPEEGYEINYYVWDSQNETYVLVGQEYLYCGMVRPQSWGQTSFGINDCGAIKEEMIFGCSTGSFDYSVWWWTGVVWSQEAVCHA